MPRALLLRQPVGVLAGQRPHEPRLAVVDVPRGADRQRPSIRLDADRPQPRLRHAVTASRFVREPQRASSAGRATWRRRLAAADDALRREGRRRPAAARTRASADASSSPPSSAAPAGRAETERSRRRRARASPSARASSSARSRVAASRLDLGDHGNVLERVGPRVSRARIGAEAPRAAGRIERGEHCAPLPRRPSRHSGR